MGCRAARRADTACWNAACLKLGCVRPGRSAASGSNRRMGPKMHTAVHGTQCAPQQSAWVEVHLHLMSYCRAVF